MLVIKAARKPISSSRGPKIALAVAGGGPIGGIFEIGAVRALEDAIEGLDMNGLDVYVGISSGAYVAASLANRISTAELCRIFITGNSDQFSFRPENFCGVCPAFRACFSMASRSSPAILSMFVSPTA